MLLKQNCYITQATAQQGKSAEQRFYEAKLPNVVHISYLAIFWIQPKRSSINLVPAAIIARYTVNNRLDFNFLYATHFSYLACVHSL